jgi:competence protein ComEA
MWRACVIVLLFTMILMCGAAIAQKKPLPAAPVNVNTASIAQLKTLPGLGDATAHAIVSYREKNGAFKRIEELLIIKGVSKRRLEEWKPFLKIN